MLAAILLLQILSPDVVVTAKRLSEAETVCRRGQCTPLRDAQVSIAFAETQFRDGRYLDARRTLAAAVARQRGAAATAPKPVAALYEAYATVALHEGDQDIYKRAVAGRVRTLRENLPAGDPWVVAAAPALGDMWVKLGGYRQADAAYRAAEQAATAAGQGRAAMLAGMKRVSLASATGDDARATRLLNEIAARPAASEPVIATVLRILRFRIAARRADDAAMTRLAGEVGQSQGAVPALLWAPPFPRDAAAAANGEARKFGQIDSVQTRSGDLDGVQWIDVGFWIRPDGRTAEAEILRGSTAHPWADAIVTQIEGRRYATTAAGEGADTGLGGIYRVERVTRRSTYITPVGSMIRRRVAADGFETLDLTEAKAVAG